MIKKTGKIVLRVLLGIVAFFALYFAFTFLLTIIPSNRQFQPAPEGLPLYIISNGVHTDICFALQEAHLNWDQALDFSRFQTKREAIRYLSFGWGDKGFYFDTPTWAELSAKTALTAAFLPSPTAMHVTLLDREPQLGDRIKKVYIKPEQLQNIEQYIFDTFQVKQGKGQHIDCCRYDGYDDNFFEAKGSYHMIRTCNVWANQSLLAGGIKTASWAPFDRCILYHF